MPFTVQVGAEDLLLRGAGDLGKLLKPDLPFILRCHLDDKELGGLTLANALTGDLTFGLDGGKGATWEIPASPSITFVLKPTAQVTVEIRNSGELFSYNEGDHPDKKISVSVPAGSAYLSLRFQVGIDVAPSAEGGAGGFGVTGAIDSGHEFNIVNHRTFPASTPVLTALRSCFENFVWPFQASAVNALNDGDFLDYEFLGNLSLGFGVSYGVSHNLLGGRYRGELSQSLQFPLGKAVVCANPALSASASFAVTYSHSDAFRIIVGRTKHAGTNSASLYLFRMNKAELDFTETAGIKVSAGVKVAMGARLDEAIDHISQSAFSGVDDKAVKQAATGALKLALNKSADAVNDYLKDVDKVIADKLKPINGQKIQLQFEQEQIHTDTALFEFDFDFNQPDALNFGYAKAIQGDYVAAIQIAGVTLRPGSAIENSFVRSSSATFQFFEIFKATDVVSYLTDTKLTYLGAGTFRFLGKAGVTTSLGFNKRGNECEVFFTAEATEKAGATELNGLNVRLNFVLTDHSADSERQTARALTAIDAFAFPATTPNGTLKVSAAFDESAYGAIQWGGEADANNYAAFVAATNSVTDPFQQFPKEFATYSRWVLFNQAKTGATHPDRKHPGNAATNLWPPEIPVPDGTARDTMECYVYAAQSYMNLCESLQHLARDLDAGAYHDQQKLLMDALGRIIDQNIAVFFIKPTLVALIRTTGAQVAAVKTVAAASASEISFTASKVAARS